ncbi:NCS2 family nucleobase:cation symporter-2/xanthine permease XanP [Halanaerobium saccharolyticum]|jgi:NCS2 family nucleobase:cation symporter-2/xanthine permease XanP|uniref:NCS2 family nucleobase:cation symporter-2/xanthine permease XanP n=1 Tax=Halanaerobium saccharolyticum TaxID=43595 RepID=A0A2T5RPL0_9FIRM|nr:nucleobase:cation symporter-2 family protein [Halanaerobium saccharolyticum]PTW01766.1 NCS2 family nucleobase:cation symporter-2/xanthine permease XanP [Halanaerobium saccharolyticum]
MADNTVKVTKEIETTKSSHYALNDQPPMGRRFLLGLQHMLAMFVGVITPPILIANAAGLGAAGTSFMVSMTLIMSGIVTFVQCKRFGPIGAGLLGVTGTSFTFVPMAMAAANAGGIPLVLGMAMVTAPVEILLSRFLKQIRSLFPPLVTGTVVTLIGLTLIKTGMQDFAGGAGAENFGSLSNLLLGSFVLVIIIIASRFGSGLIKLGAIAIGLISGYIISIPLGLIDFAPVFNEGWLTIPRPLYFGLDFDFAHLLPWMIAYVVTSIESIGDLTAIAETSGEPVNGQLHQDRLSRGLLAEGLGSMISSLFNVMPNTTFSQNIGVIQITKVGSRVVGYVVAVLLLLLGLFPKFGAVISVMPAPVLGGATLALFGMIASAGVNIVTKNGFSDRTAFIFSISLSIGLGVTYFPEIAQSLPAFLEVLFSSGVAVGAVLAVFLNLIVPEE